MMMRSRKMKGIRINRVVLALLVSTGMLTSCREGLTGPTPTPRPNFIPPTSDPADVQASGADFTPLPTRQMDCANQLQFVDDLTIPDGTEVEPGQSITKRWLVKNSGTCNWDGAYSLQLISGLGLGAEKVQDLFPARQSTEAVIEILFTAPDNPGRYNSWWQAYDPDGNRFGDPIYVEISVVSDSSEG